MIFIKKFAVYKLEQFMDNTSRFDKYTVVELKSKDFKELCELYDGYIDGGTNEFDNRTLRFMINTVESNYQQTKKINKKKLGEFTLLLNWLSIYHEAFFFHYTVRKEEIAKGYCDSCALRISKIQNSYVVPITNSLTLRKADISIWAGIIAIILSIWLSSNSSKSIYKIEDKVENILDLSHLLIDGQSEGKSLTIKKYEVTESEINKIKTQNDSIIKLLSQNTENQSIKHITLHEHE